MWYLYEERASYWFIIEHLFVCSGSRLLAPSDVPRRRLYPALVAVQRGHGYHHAGGMVYSHDHAHYPCQEDQLIIPNSISAVFTSLV